MGASALRTFCAVLLIAISSVLFLNGFAVVLLAGAKLLYPTIDANGRLSFASGLAGYAIYAALSACGFVLAYVLYRIARRLTVPVFTSIADVQEAARRRGQGIILFLREFGSDTVRRKRDVQSLRDYFITQEERIARAASSFGLAVAIGRPGEKLPPGGAARLYVSEAELRGTVGRLIQLADLIVMRVGAAASSSWEIEQLVRRRKLGRTIFVPTSGDDAQNPVALQRLEALLQEVTTTEELVPPEVLPLTKAMGDLQRQIVDGGEMILGSAHVFADSPEVQEALARFKVTHEAAKASQRSFELGHYSFPTVMVRHESRMVPFFSKTEIAMHDAAKLLGLRARPNRLSTVGLLALVLVMALLFVSFFVYWGCRAAGLAQCTAYAGDASIALLFAMVAAMAIAFVVSEFSF